jgi:cathepsin L
MGFLGQFVLLLAIGSPAWCFAAGNEESNSLPSFASFIARYDRVYAAGSKEYDMRRNLYEQSCDQVRHQNSNMQRLWSAAVNHLSDRTDTELSQLRGLRIVQSTRKGGRSAGVIGTHSNRQFLSQIRSSVLPEEKSWAHLAAVTQDIDQKACGSCWAVATSIMLQAGAEINGLNRTFSPQELVDCVSNSHNCGGSGGCQGATVELAMNWVMENGLADSTETPYVGSDTYCKKEAHNNVLLAHDGSGNNNLEDMIAVGFHAATSTQTAAVALQVLGWERLPENEYLPLIKAVAERGPAAVSVGAAGWQPYKAGIFDGCTVDAEIDHAVTLIGYGIDKEKNQKFWLIKNSWGNMWGEDGNIRLLRHEGKAHCGTDHQPKVGTGCDGGPDTVPVCGMCGILYDAVVPHFANKK